jgi:hypothetical protein
MINAAAMIRIRKQAAAIIIVSRISSGGLPTEPRPEVRSFDRGQQTGLWEPFRDTRLPTGQSRQLHRVPSIASKQASDSSTVQGGGKRRGARMADDSVIRRA